MSLATIVGAARSEDARVGAYDNHGRRLAVAGALSRAVEPLGDHGKLARHSVRAGGTQLALLAGPLNVQDRPVGILAVAIRSGPALSGVRSAGLRLALVLLVAMAGIVAIGAFLTRGIVSELQPLMATNRALGSGDLSARAPVESGGELGELAAGINQMAEQLQAAVETLELRVTERTEEIRRLMDARTEFFAGLSHELRTPIATILAQADLLASNDLPGPAASPIIQASGRQLLQVVNEILELAKAEAGRIDVELSDVRVASAVRELRPTFVSLAATGDVQLSVKIPRGLPPVHADPSRLREVLLNLVDNAVKYTPPGGRVEVSAVTRNGNVELHVADTGVGIPADAQAHIFEPFFRVKGTEAQRGQDSSGLGLAIAKRLIEAQGGTIDFESNGAGTKFTVRLPVA
jgi:signal transduction histidine kinase